MWPFKPQAPKPKRKVNVRRAFVIVRLNDESEFDLQFEGEWCGTDPFGDGDLVYDASERVEDWQRANGKRGTVSMGKGLYVPLCNVKDINVTYSDHDEEVEG